MSDMLQLRLALYTFQFVCVQTVLCRNNNVHSNDSLAGHSFPFCTAINLPAGHSVSAWTFCRGMGEKKNSTKKQNKHKQFFFFANFSGQSFERLVSQTRRTSSEIQCGAIGN